MELSCKNCKYSIKADSTDKPNHLCDHKESSVFKKLCEKICELYELSDN
mgnify:CR=1 FL=1